MLLPRLSPSRTFRSPSRTSELRFGVFGLQIGFFGLRIWSLDSEWLRMGSEATPTDFSDVLELLWLQKFGLRIRVVRLWMGVFGLKIAPISFPELNPYFLDSTLIFGLRIGIFRLWIGVWLKIGVRIGVRRLRFGVKRLRFAAAFGVKLQFEVTVYFRISSRSPKTPIWSLLRSTRSLTRSRKIRFGVQFGLFGVSNFRTFQSARSFQSLWTPKTQIRIFRILRIFRIFQSWFGVVDNFSKLMKNFRSPIMAF